MNRSILDTEIQSFINKNLTSDIPKLLLKGHSFERVSIKEIVEQIDAKKRCKKKLPIWFSTENIYYPNRVNIEQTSSEITAQYKSKLVSGDTLIDITGGFGVDSFYFSKLFKTVTHCETNTKLSEIVHHNFSQLKTDIKCINDDGINVLKTLDRPFDCLYVDPSRRDDKKDKVFLLSHCTPNIKTFQGLFLKYAKIVMVKVSPLLDIKATLQVLKYVKSIHIVAINNEVKELLFILERHFEGTPIITTINLLKNNRQIFKFKWGNESALKAEYSEPLTYLYEPNAAILKSGGFNTVCEAFNVKKLQQHSHIYTSENSIDFPGRRFRILKSIPFNKKLFSKEKISKANITVRNFPLGVRDIRKKLNIKDGGQTYLFFTTNYNNEKIIVVCIKENPNI